MRCSPAVMARLVRRLARRAAWPKSRSTFRAPTIFRMSETTAGSAGTTAGIVYEQAVRAVEQQARQLDELRTRTSVVLAAAGVVTGFLGGAAVKAGLGAFGYFAVASFVVA